MNEVGLRQSGGLISAVLAEKTAKTADQRRKTADHDAANRHKFNHLRKNSATEPNSGIFPPQQRKKSADQRIISGLSAEASAAARSAS
jgi:hypothetical protein